MKQEVEMLKRELNSLKRKHRVFQVITLAVLAFAIISAFTQSSNSSFEKITAKEIVVKDENGQDRIIISSAIAASDSRLRRDTLEGILILDETGTDRVVLGATPTIQSDGEIVKRINGSNPYGFAFNDDRGNERGGFGFYDSRGLVSFGMDNKTGEGLTMFVADDNLYGQKVGLVMNTAERGQVVYLGASQVHEVMLNLDAPGKGRLSIKIDSSSYASIKHFDYQNNSSKSLLQTN